MGGVLDRRVGTELMVIHSLALQTKGFYSEIEVY